MRRAYGELGAELESLASSGFDREALEELLSREAPAVGAFSLLYALERSGMELKDFARSTRFLFARHEVLAELLPFRDSSLDAVLYAWTLHEMERGEIERSLEEGCRVLREGGSAYVVEREGVAPLELIERVVEREGLEGVAAEALSPVCDRERASRALLLVFSRRRAAKRRRRGPSSSS